MMSSSANKERHVLAEWLGFIAHVDSNVDSWLVTFVSHHTPLFQSFVPRLSIFKWRKTLKYKWGKQIKCISLSTYLKASVPNDLVSCRCTYLWYTVSALSFRGKLRFPGKACHSERALKVQPVCVHSHTPHDVLAGEHSSMSFSLPPKPSFSIKEQGAQNVV